MKKYIFLILCFLCLPIGLYGCTNKSNIDGIEIVVDSSVMYVGESQTITVKFSPEGESDKFQLTSTDNSVVSIMDDKKTIIALKSGSAILCASVNDTDIKNYLNITVYERAKKLANPTQLSEDEKGNIIWSEVENASYYLVELNGAILEKHYLTNKFSDYEVGKENAIRVKAIGDGINYLDSDFSNTYTFIKLNPIRDVKYENGKITWQSDSAKIFDVTINGISQNLKLTNKEYIINDDILSVGENKLRIIGYASETDSLNNTGYSDSVIIVKTNKVSALEVKDGFISWEEVDGCVYDVTISNEKGEETCFENRTDNSLLITAENYTPGVYSVSVLAKYNGEKRNYVNSKAQDENDAGRKVTFVKLSDVKNMKVENDFVVFDEILMASGYEVYVDNNKTFISTNKFALSNLTPGLYKIKVKAIGGGIYLDSEESGEMEVNVLQAPVLTFNNQTQKIDFNEIESVNKYILSITKPDGNIVEIKGDKQLLQNAVNFDLSGDYILKIKALNDEIEGYSVGSLYSSNLVVHKLEKVDNLQILKNVNQYQISFNTVIGATGYILKIYNTEHTQILSADLNDNIYFINLNELDESHSMPSGTYYFTVQAIYEGTQNIISSDVQNKNANEKVATFVRLSAPTNIYAEGTFVKWDLIENATQYDVVYKYKNANEVVRSGLITNQLAFDFGYEFTFKIKSINNENVNNFYVESEYSEEIAFEKLFTPTLLFDGQYITWEINEKASDYNLYINSIKYDYEIDEINNRCYFDIANLNYSNSYSVILNMVGNYDENYLDSNITFELVLNKLIIYNLTARLNNNQVIVSWNRVNNTNGYILTVNDGEDILIASTETSYTFDAVEKAYTRFSLVALGNSEKRTIQSAKSTIETNFYRCSTIPLNEISIDSDLLTFSTVENSTSYLIEIQKLNNGVYEDFNSYTITQNRFDLNDVLDVGKFRVRLKALGNNRLTYSGYFSEYFDEIEKLDAPIGLNISEIDDENFADYYLLKFETDISNPMTQVEINNVLLERNNSTIFEGKEILIPKNLVSRIGENTLKVRIVGDGTNKTISSNYSENYTITNFNNLQNILLETNGLIYIDEMKTYKGIAPTYKIHVSKQKEDLSFEDEIIYPLSGVNYINSKYYFSVANLGKGVYKVYFSAELDVSSLETYFVKTPIAYSSVITATVLEAPVVSYVVEDNSQKFIWNEIENANGYYYELTVDGSVLEKGNTNNLYYIPKLSSTNDNQALKFKVYAVGNKNTKITNSAYSNIISGVKLGKSYNIELDSTTSVYTLTWDNVNTDIYYDVYINGDLVCSTLTADKQINLSEFFSFTDPGTYTLYIIAKASESASFDSSKSENYSISKYSDLEDAKIVGAVLYFKGGGTKFNIIVNDSDIYDLEQNTTTKQFDIHDFSIGTKFTIKDLGNGKNILPSDSTINIIYNPLSAVSNIRIEENKIKWDSVVHATGYLINLKNSSNNIINTYNFNADQNEFSLPEDKLSGTYIFDICAVGDYNYSNSVFTQYTFKKSNLISNLTFETDANNYTQESVKLTWVASEGYSGFKVYVKNLTTDEINILDCATTSYIFTIPSSSTDVYEFSVLVVGNYAENYLDSSISSSKITSCRISEIGRIYTDKFIIRWNSVQNASNYLINIENNTTGDLLIDDLLISSNSYDTSNLNIHNGDEITVQITPIGNGKNYLTGKTKTIVFSKLTNPALSKIENGIVIENASLASSYHLFVLKPNETQFTDITSLLSNNKLIIPQDWLSGEYTFKCYIDGGDDKLSSHADENDITLIKLPEVKDVALENIQNVADDDYKTILTWDYDESCTNLNTKNVIVRIVYSDHSVEEIKLDLSAKNLELDGKINLGVFNIEIYITGNTGFAYSRKVVLGQYSKINTNEFGLKIENGALIWNSIESVSDYVVVVNDGMAKSIGNSNQLKLDDEDVFNVVQGSMTVKLKAISNIENNKISSNFTSITVTKLEKPTLIINNGNLEVDDIENDLSSYDHEFYIFTLQNGNYNYVESGTYEDTMNFLSKNSQSDYYIKLKLLGKNKNINSDFSNLLHVKALSAPIDYESNEYPKLVKNNNSDNDWLLEWKVVDDALGYKISLKYNLITVSEFEISNKDINSIQIPTDLEAGNYTVCIQSYTTSDHSSYLINSEIINYTFKKLSTPVVYLSKGLLSWYSVIDAIKYKLYVNDTLEYEGNDLSYNFSTIRVNKEEYPSNVCELKIKLVAITNGEDNSISSSFGYVYTLYKPITPGVLSVNNGSLVWNNSPEFYTIYNNSNNVIVRIFDANQNRIAEKTVPRTYFTDGWPSRNLVLSEIVKLEVGGKYYIQIAEEGSTYSLLDANHTGYDYIITSDFNKLQEIYIPDSPELIHKNSSTYIYNNKLYIKSVNLSKYNGVITYWVYVNGAYVYEIDNRSAIDGEIEINLDNLNLSNDVTTNKSNKLITVCVKGNTYESDALTNSYISGIMSQNQVITVLNKIYGLRTENGDLIWNKVDGCEGYEIFVTNGQTGVTKTYLLEGEDNTRFDFSENAVGDLSTGINSIKIRALGNGYSTTNGAYSDVVVFNKLSNEFDFRLIEGKLAFVYDSHYTYKLKIDDEVEYIINSKDIDIQNGYALFSPQVSDTFNHSFSIKVIGNSSVTEGNYYLTSDYSSKITASCLTSIKSITITDNGYITWMQEVNRNNGFKIFINDTDYNLGVIRQNYITSFPSELDVSGALNIKVMAIGNSGNTGALYLNSNLGDVSLEVTKLDPVQLFRIENGVLYWNKVNFASGYVITVAPQSVGSSSFTINIDDGNTTNYNISENDMFIAGAYYNLSIYAKGSLENNTINSFSTKKNYQVVNSIVHEEDFLVRKLSTPSNIRYSKVSDNEIYIEWNVVEGSNYYEITLLNTNLNTSVKYYSTESRFNIKSNDVQLISGNTYEMSIIAKNSERTADVIYSNVSNVYTIQNPEKVTDLTYDENDYKFEWGNNLDNNTYTYKIFYSIYSYTNGEYVKVQDYSKDVGGNTYFYVEELGYYHNVYVRAYSLESLESDISNILFESDYLKFDLFTGGIGTSIDPYHITSYNELKNMEVLPFKNFVLVNNIDLTNENVDLFNDKQNPFKGEFDGNNYTITLKLNSVEGTVKSLVSGLFGYVSNTIKNLNIVVDSSQSPLKFNMTRSTSLIVGLLVGTLLDGGYLDNCTVTGSDITIIESNCSIIYFGGLVGNNENSTTINNCSNYVNIINQTTNVITYMGGIIAENYGYLQYCYNYGNISGNIAGGISARNLENANILKCINNGYVSINNINTRTNIQYAGGITGMTYGKVENNINYGKVSILVSNNSNLYIGGITGYYDKNGMYNCVNIGSLERVDTTGKIGNLIGRTDNASLSANSVYSYYITSSYSTIGYGSGNINTKAFDLLNDIINDLNNYNDGLTVFSIENNKLIIVG